MPEINMPAYKSHKIVHALKIKSICEWGAGKYMIEPVERGYAPFEVSAHYVKRHSPVVGGYFVEYEDGYQSWSPAEAFEKGYTRI